MSQASDMAAVPRVGMLAVLRNRRGLISSVDPYDGPEGREYLVEIEYTDTEGVPEDTVLWNREHGAQLLEPNALPRVGSEPPMPAAEFDALVRATRWSALIPFLSPNDDTQRSELPIAAPFFGAVQVDDFQLVPLLKALQMPRVSLLLADDVGLGKTIEAGLILTELLSRRRIRRVLVLTPAALKGQWRQEMRDKFSLTFDIVDREETHALQKRIGFDANPWRTYPRIISSYHYLRQPDILEEFLATCRVADEGLTARLPWDLLIVDEAHNLTPAAYGDDSDLSKMLGAISPYFEHKLFLTATPHNGHTRSFSGLLELLDPVRFTQTSEFKDADKERIEQVVVRRLKSEINELDASLGRPRRFAERFLEPLPLFFGQRERRLSKAVEEFRAEVKKQVASSGRSEQLAGNFAIEVLAKRLLSCPSTFAESWYRFRAGVDQSEVADASEVNTARRAAEADIDDDLEREGRTHHAAYTVGAWMHPFIDVLAEQVTAIDQALADLGIKRVADGPPTVPEVEEDARLGRLFKLVREKLRTPDGWRDDERLIVFTEYKTTLDYLEKRLKTEFDDDGSAILVLYGGMDEKVRDKIKEAFNDPDHTVRALVATDAASEGLNLQETARLLLHYEIPWNPARLDQRNGRLDRHGQARDVLIYHFTSDDDADMRFIAHVVAKVDEMREDLGSVGELFDAAFERRFQDLEDTDRVTESLDREMEATRGRAEIPREETTDTGEEEAERLGKLARQIDLSPQTLRDTLEIALGIDYGHPRLEGPDKNGRMRLTTPVPPRWEGLIDDTLRLDSGRGLGALPKVVFDPSHFIEDKNGRPVFRPARDTKLLHLGHPLFRHALATFARARFPGGGAQELSPSRWIVRHGEVPEGAEALILLSVEELAVNELRESFHHWIRTLRLPVSNGEVRPPERHLPAAEDHPMETRVSAETLSTAADLWDDVRLDLEFLLRKRTDTLTERISEMLAQIGEGAIVSEKERFEERIREVRAAMRKTTIEKLERERAKIQQEMQQLTFSESKRRDQQARLRGIEEELQRRQSHYQQLLESLQRDQERVLEHVLPDRYRLRGNVQVYPVTVEIRLPEASQ